MDFFTLTRKRQRRTHFNRSSEMQFFLDNNILLRSNPMFMTYANAQRSFDIVRANIIIRGLINKKTIEKIYFSLMEGQLLETINKEQKEEVSKKVQAAISDLPYAFDQESKIYIPFFSRSINRIYEKDFWKLEEMPYKSLLKDFESIISDPFDLYGDDLYNSIFTKLVRLKKTREGSAFYDYDALAIYFVNKGGRLEEAIYLFDKDLRKPSPNHMIGKLIPVVNAYYSGNKDAFFAELVKNRLISSRLLAKHLDSIRSNKSGDNAE